MALISLARKLFRTLARIVPQCGMVSQAVAFNMFLAFFPMLLFGLGLLSSSLRGENGKEITARLSAILPPGSWQLVSDFLLRRDVDPLRWTLFGAAGALLAGSQVIKLIMEGISLIYGDSRRHSFHGRQLRGLLLFSVTGVVWAGAVALSVYGGLLTEWITNGLGPTPLVRGLLKLTLEVAATVLALFVLTLIYRVARPGSATWISFLPGAAMATFLWVGVNLLFGAYVRRVQYGPVYGGLAAAIGLMVWMEVSAMLVFFGAAWNAEGALRNASGSSL
jgi:membrane protein